MRQAAEAKMGFYPVANEALGIAPTTLEARIRRLGIDKHSFRPRQHGR